ncbi:MAG: hypothetical protein KC442_12345 [Thermomicrobiales bacterium]|nr:hypothetical protein [Thermomicrobiales bacterium]
MLARRDVLRLMTATAAARHLPFTLTPEEAAAKLDESVPFDVEIAPPPSHDGYGWAIPSATDFANAMRRSLFDEDWGGFGDAPPEYWAAYKQALGAVIDLAPEILGHPGPTPVAAMDEAVLALVCASWEAGVRVGAQMEMLRQALLAPTAICPSCNGHGRRTAFNTGGGRDSITDTQLVLPCAQCAGAGIIAIQAV